LEGDYIFEEAERMHKKYKTHDPFELLDCIGAVTHISYEYERGGLKGYSTILSRTKYAVINGRLNKDDRRIVAGHEVAHLIIHVDVITSSPIQALRDFNMWDNSGRTEQQANLFAADFMLEDTDVLEAIYTEGADFFASARELYVPPPLLAFKLFSMARRGYEVWSPIDLDSKFLGK